jgi:hypothetical protein
MSEIKKFLAFLTSNYIIYDSRGMLGKKEILADYEKHCRDLEVEKPLPGQMEIEEFLNESKK